MEKIKYQLILASASPRRKELLAYTYLPFEIRVSHVEEISSEIEPTKFAMDLAKLKAKDILETSTGGYNNPLVLGADTIVCFGDEILGKPKSTAEAREILLKLSGNEHVVVTGVCLASRDKCETFFSSSRVRFEIITPDLMEHYLKTGESMDKAGAYGIQAHSLGFISSLNGSYSNVVGLPVNLVIKKIKEFLNAQDDSEGKWRNLFE